MLGETKRDRKAERRAATRLEILEAAWEIAGESGLNQVTLRDVAARVGMQAPSLYTHFASKLAIYDGMYAQAWSDYESLLPALDASLPEDDPRGAATQLARHFYDYATADLARHQLMNQRIVPGFEPTPEAYAPAVRVFEHARARVERLGAVDTDDFELFVALVGGLVNQHHANDPNGTRYADLLHRGLAMWADSVGLPPSTTDRSGPPRKEPSR